MAITLMKLKELNVKQCDLILSFAIQDVMLNNMDINACMNFWKLLHNDGDYEYVSNLPIAIHDVAPQYRCWQCSTLIEHIRMLTNRYEQKYIRLLEAAFDDE